MKRTAPPSVRLPARPAAPPTGPDAEPPLPTLEEGIRLIEKSLSEGKSFREIQKAWRKKAARAS